MFTNENFDSIPNKGASPFPSISDFQVTMQGIHRLLLNLDPHKPPGPDNIRGRFLKQTASEIAPLLTHLFQQSLNSGEVPMAWRQAYITPIFKKGDRSDPKNYHPVSLTSIVCKTMEHVLVSQIMHHLETNNILVETQFGFRVNHSCESQLLLTVDDLARAVDKRLQVGCSILDFSKAFDKVSHARLIHKLLWN